MTDRDRRDSGTDPAQTHALSIVATNSIGALRMASRRKVMLDPLRVLEYAAILAVPHRLANAVTFSTSAPPPAAEVPRWRPLRQAIAVHRPLSENESS